MTLTTLLTGAATSPVTAAYARLTEVFPGLRAEVLEEDVSAP
ncbi:iron-sulfur protein, partial [Streptomyces sp. SID8455]|nr:iron-sulfur protein [Streptomyces sp. SID8455]